MNIRIPIAWGIAISVAMGMAACGGGQGGKEAAATDTLKTVTEDRGLVKVGGKVISIPSPIQTVMLAHELKAAYVPTLALTPDSVARFTDSRKKALALGVYGADLAYITLYQDGQRALKTLKAVESLSNGLNLSSAVDKDLMNRFKANVNNQDSLLRLTGAAFRAVDAYLKNEERNDVSTQVLTGGWVEGLYLTLGTSGSKVDKKVATRMAEQRHTLDNLIELHEKMDGEDELLALLKDLAASYSNIKSEYKFVQPTLDAANKTTYINSSSSVELPDEALQEIIRKVRAIRSAIIA